MKIHINTHNTQFAHANNDVSKNTQSNSTVNEEKSPKVDVNDDNPDNQRQDFNLVKGSAYEQIFQNEELDFSNMSLNELHSLVKNVNEMHREYASQYGNDGPTQVGKSGNPIISKERENLLDLEGTLEVLSFGGGNVDPNKKIDILAYFSAQSDRADEKAKSQPMREDLTTSASYMKEILNTLDYFTSEDTFDLYKEKAALLNIGKPKVDTFI